MKKIIFLSILAVFLSGCAGDQLLFQPEIHFFGGGYGGYEYGVYRYPRVMIVNNTKYTLCILVDGDEKGRISLGQRLKLIFPVWPRENREVSFVALAYDGDEYIGATHPRSLTAYMSVNYSRSDAFVISDHDIRRK